MAEQKIKGNIAGIRSVVLRQMEELFFMDMEPLRHAFLPEELARALCALTQRCNREVMVYVARDGQVLEVIVGSHDRVDLPRIQVRRGKRRLTGVRAIHTHPEGVPYLSDVDMKALLRMRFDAMASLGVSGGEPTGMEIALIEDIDEAGEFIVSRTGAIGPQELRQSWVYPPQGGQDDILARIALNDERVARAARALEARESEEERALLVGIESMESLEELGRLAHTAGAVVVDMHLQRKSAADPSSYIGRGKAQDLAMAKQLSDANLIIIDDELTAAQSSRLEELIGCRVVDRTALILDIFAGRAQSREGRLQVELAQHKYRLPRLSGSRGVELSRLGGGIGTRGPGESQLETDRRHIRRRITELEREVSNLEKQRGIRRRRRGASGIPTVALVGYTNAGKSTLLNSLSGAGVLAEDKLFATLDPVTRRIEYQGRPLLVTDTVGFIKKLPHDLVEAFRSTLEETVHADVLVHVVDASSPQAWEQYQVAREVLHSLGAGKAPAVVALNKMDLAAAGMMFYTADEPCVELSALEGQGVERLMEAVFKRLDEGVVEINLLVPYEKGALLSDLHRVGTVCGTVYAQEGTYLRLSADRAALKRLGEELTQYQVEEIPHGAMP